MSCPTALALALLVWLAARLRRQDVDHTAECKRAMAPSELEQATAALDELSDAAQRASRRS